MQNISHLKDYLVKKLPTNYENLISEIQEEYDNNIWDLNKGNLNKTDKKEIIFKFLKEQLDSKEFDLGEYSLFDLVLKIYNDIVNFSILTKPLIDNNVTKIIISSWKNVNITFYDGTTIDIGGFVSPKQAKEILQRLLLETDIVCEKTSTIDYINKDNVHIVAVLPPLVDDNTALFVSLNKLKKSSVDINNKKLDFINYCIQHGVSTLVVSNENNTSQLLIDNILSKMSTQVLSLNDNLISNDYVINISPNIPTSHILKLNPSIVVINEKKLAYEISLTGFTVITSIQAKTIKHSYIKIATEIHKEQGIDFNTALKTVCSVFPLSVYVTTTKDGIARMINISECCIENDKIIFNTLFEFQLEENTVNMESINVVGEFKKTSNISENLLSILKMYGATNEELEKLIMM